jgi:hypothetical protein
MRKRGRQREESEWRNKKGMRRGVMNFKGGGCLMFIFIFFCLSNQTYKWNLSNGTGYFGVNLERER